MVDLTLPGDIHAAAFPADRHKKTPHDNVIRRFDAAALCLENCDGFDFLFGCRAVGVIRFRFGDFVQRIEAVGQNAECSILTIEMRGVLMHDEEL